MIAVVRTRTLRALRAGIAEAEATAEAARAEATRHQQEAETAFSSVRRAETALEDLRTTHARTAGELETLRPQVFLDTEDRAALRMLLRTTRKTASARHVFVLLHLGKFHSVHETREAAEKAAERDGAHPDGWLTQGEPGTQRPDSEVLWRIRPTLLPDGAQ